MKRKERKKSSVTQMMKVLCYHLKLNVQIPIDVMRERREV